MIIDATEEVVVKIQRSDGELSENIFLYQCVVITDSETSPVVQMISEAHHTSSHSDVANGFCGQSGVSIPE